MHGNTYQGFIPLFVYSINKAYPEVDIKIFIKGALNLKNKDRIKGMKCDIYDNFFKEYENRESMSNSLRFLVPSSYFKDYRDIYITDIDFIFFPQSRKYYD